MANTDKRLNINDPRCRENAEWFVKNDPLCPTMTDAIRIALEERRERMERKQSAKAAK